MVRGYAADTSDNSFMNLNWIDGEPEHKSFLGIKAINLDTTGKVKRIVRGIRCEACGLLELYAV